MENRDLDGFGLICCASMLNLIREMIITVQIALLGSIPILIKGQEARPKIYTYHRGSISLGDNLRSFQIRQWFRNWHWHGYDPHLLVPADAARHPEYATLKARFYKLPTVNSRVYEMACYLRWLAYSRVKEVSLFSDYDIFSFGHQKRESTNNGSAVAFSGLLPMFIQAGPMGIEKLIKELANYVPDSLDTIDVKGRGMDNAVGGLELVDKRMHVSDMTILRRRNTTAFAQVIPVTDEDTRLSQLDNWLTCNGRAARLNFPHGVNHFSAYDINMASRKYGYALDRRYFPNDVLTRQYTSNIQLYLFDLTSLDSRPTNHAAGQSHDNPVRLQIINDFVDHFSCTRTKYIQDWQEKDFGCCNEIKEIFSLSSIKQPIFNSTTFSRDQMKNHLIVFLEDPLIAAWTKYNSTNYNQFRHNQISQRIFGKDISKFKKVDQQLIKSTLAAMFGVDHVTLFFVDRLHQSKLVAEYSTGLVLPFIKFEEQAQTIVGAEGKGTLGKPELRWSQQYKSHNWLDIMVHRWLLKSFREQLTIYEHVEARWKKGRTAQ